MTSEVILHLETEGRCQHDVGYVGLTYVYLRLFILCKSRLYWECVRGDGLYIFSTLLARVDRCILCL